MYKGKQKIFSPVVLLLIDGWGLSPGWGGNAIVAARPSNFNYYWKNYPHVVLKALSLIADDNNQISDYKLAYTLLSSGKIIQPISQIISLQIQNGIFYQNQALKKLFSESITNQSRIHFIGNISYKNSKGNQDHLLSLINFAKNEGVKQTFIHAILDSSSENNKLSLGILKNLNDQLLQSQIASLSSIVGKNWVETSQIKKLKQSTLSLFQTNLYCTNFPAQIASYYQEKITDSNIPPTTVMDYRDLDNRISDGDIVFFFNFDNSNIQMWLKLFAKIKKNIQIITLAQEDNCDFDYIYPKERIGNSLSEIISRNNLNQVKIYESIQRENLTTYFNNSSNLFPGEKRIEIETVDVPYYDWPQMSSIEIKEEAKKAILSKKYDFLTISLANVDYLSRYQKIEPLMEGINIADKIIADLVQTTLAAGGTFFMTATHGNAEQISDIQYLPENIHSKYSLNPVPLIEINEFNKKDISQLSQNLVSGSIVGEIMIHNYTIADIAPTILNRLNITPPPTMSGKNLDVLKK